MNGFQHGPSPYEYPPLVQGGDKSVVGALGSDAVGGAQPRLGPPATIVDDALPMRAEPTPNSALADLKDPIQVHLLTETALSDSKDYPILTQEEVDKLKKQCQLWSQRVEVTRSNLAIQSKYRDAAVSMAKLHAAGKTPEEVQRDHAAVEAKRERREMEKKCDDLLRELLDLEKQLLGPQRRLLQHTAGILQLTHKVSRRKAQLAGGQANHNHNHSRNHNHNGVPSSPESLYTLSHSRDSLAFPADENYVEALPGFHQLDHAEMRPPPLQRSTTIDIPLKSPVREKTNQLRGEIDSMREENTTLTSIISETEKKLMALTVSLREIIIRFNPEANGDYLDPPHPSCSTPSFPSPSPSTPDADRTKPGDTLRSQIDYLENGLVAVQAEQQSLTGGGGGGSGSSSSSSDEIESVLVDLWTKIQAGFAATKQRNEERRKHRAERGLTDETESSEDDVLFDGSEVYSLAAFSSRVEWLYQQTSMLKDQKSVLKRQIKQQREMNNKTDAEKDEEIERIREDLDQTRLLLDRADKDTTDAQTMLSEALQDLERAREATVAADTAAEQELRARGSRIESLETEARARSARIETLEGELQAHEDKDKAKTKTAGGEAERLAELRFHLEEATRERQRAEDRCRALQQEAEYNRTDLSTKDAQLSQREEEMEQLQMTIAELKTEVTIARAELDGAYGSRAERAADVAALKNDAELVRLRKHVDRLKRELAGTVADLEAITKETIGAERDRIDLEQRLDQALLDRAELEADVARARHHVARLQDDLDAERFKVAAAPGAGGSSRLGAGASMLSEQFRSTMREERKKFQEDIREERAKIRRLEEELNRFKRSQLKPSLGTR